MSDHATLRDAIVHFSLFANCKDFMVALRWPDGKVKCPTCGAEKVTWLEKRHMWKCYTGHPSPNFSLKTGTIFEDSPIALEKWLPAVWMLLNCKNGISSYEIHRGLGVTQKTAWFMMHRIRLATHCGSFEKRGGEGCEFEADESYIGGKARNMHTHKRDEARNLPDFGKTIVAAVLERGGKIHAKVVKARRKPELQKLVRESVEAASSIYTDSLKSYQGLEEYTHQAVDHAETYVNGRVHTNGCENFWSLLKRSIHGTYVSVEPFHLFRYVDEQAWRYNNRDMTDIERFVIGMRQVIGRRVTYKQLTGKDGQVSHG